MPAVAERIPEQKRVTISSKRQVTIPQKYYVELGFDKDAICIKGEDFLILRPAAPVSGGEFAEQILADLIAEGYTGSELLDEFKSRQAKVRPAVEALLEEAREVAHGKGQCSTYNDIFGLEG
ncbi:MAG: AbrB/MazE/SpoVT family DNA-binding domain-containing protein [Lachnospiraceae bacterium]|nr:AbrB/MazE/SpoVT family DNA-binding domain-containing protein [Lachnospiraceae bacterium]